MKKTLYEVKEGDLLVKIYPNRRVLGRVTHITSMQIVGLFEDHATPERFFKLNGRRIGGGRVFVEYISESEALDLRAENESKARTERERDEKERNDPRNALIRRICGADTEEGWKSLPLEKLQEVHRILFGK